MELVAFNPKPVSLPGDLQQLCRQYLTHRSVNKSRNTVLAERTDLQQFVGYLAGLDITLIQSVGSHHIDDFMDALMMGNGVKARTAARKYESVKGLFRWARMRGVLKADPFKRLQAPKFHIDKVVAPEIGPLMRLIHSLPADTPMEKRDRLILRLTLDSALRVGGILSLDLYNDNDPPRWCVRPSGVIYYRAKGGRTEETLCDETTLLWLSEWLAVRSQFVRRDTPPALFLTKRGTRPTRQAISQMIKLRAEQGGFGHLHMHLLRHARIGQAIEKGDLHLANYLAGHKRMSTTSDMYGAQSKERLRMRLKAQCPLDVDSIEEVA